MEVSNLAPQAVDDTVGCICSSGFQWQALVDLMPSNVSTFAAKMTDSTFGVSFAKRALKVCAHGRAHSRLWNEGGGWGGVGLWGCGVRVFAPMLAPLSGTLPRTPLPFLLTPSLPSCACVRVRGCVLACLRVCV